MFKFNVYRQLLPRYVGRDLADGSAVFAANLQHVGVIHAPNGEDAITSARAKFKLLLPIVHQLDEYHVEMRWAHLST